MKKLSYLFFLIIFSACGSDSNPFTLVNEDEKICVYKNNIVFFEYNNLAFHIKLQDYLKNNPDLIVSAVTEGSVEQSGYFRKDKKGFIVSFVNTKNKQDDPIIRGNAYDKQKNALISQSVFF